MNTAVHKLVRRVSGELKRLAFSNGRLKKLKAGTYFSRYPIAAVPVRSAEPETKAAHAFILAVDACYRAAGWQNGSQIAETAVEQCRSKGYVPGIGWIHAELVELAQKNRLLARTQERMTLEQVCAAVLEDNVLVASLRGRLVLVRGFEWDGDNCSGVYTINPHSARLDEEMLEPATFSETFSGRAMFFASPTETNDSAPAHGPQVQTDTTHLPPSHCWVEVDYAAIADNLSAIRAHVGQGVAVNAVIKANAYGHGLVEVARCLERSGVEMLSVASLDEARQLREAGIQSSILVLYGVALWEVPQAIDNNLDLAVFDIPTLKAIAGMAATKDRVVNVHLKLDTGMGWFGVPSGDADKLRQFATELLRFPALVPRGVFSHFSAAASDAEHTKRQLARFETAVETLRQSGVTFEYRHIANSGGLLHHPSSFLNMVRPGLLLFGIYPDDVPHPSLSVRPALQLKAKIGQVRELAANETVGYAQFRSDRAMRVAVIPIGYADGIPRSLATRGFVLIKGTRVGLIGNICMNVCMAEITHIPEASEGDDVVIIGSSGTESISCSEAAAWADTISYELVTRIPEHISRVPRNSSH